MNLQATFDLDKAIRRRKIAQSGLRSVVVAGMPELEKSREEVIDSRVIILGVVLEMLGMGRNK